MDCATSVAGNRMSESQQPSKYPPNGTCWRVTTSLIGFALKKLVFLLLLEFEAETQRLQWQQRCREPDCSRPRMTCK
eukprot:5409084-Amphidinium_carterae.1